VGRAATAVALADSALTAAIVAESAGVRVPESRPPHPSAAMPASTSAPAHACARLHADLTRNG
jgi:hypothetical protein